MDLYLHAFVLCTGMKRLYILYKRQYFMFLSYLMVGRLFGMGILIVLYLYPLAAHLAPEVQHILDTTHFLVFLVYLLTMVNHHSLSSTVREHFFDQAFLYNRNCPLPRLL